MNGLSNSGVKYAYGGGQFGSDALGYILLIGFIVVVLVVSLYISHRIDR